MERSTSEGTERVAEGAGRRHAAAALGAAGLGKRWLAAALFAACLAACGGGGGGGGDASSLACGPRGGLSGEWSGTCQSQGFDPEPCDVTIVQDGSCLEIIDESVFDCVGTVSGDTFRCEEQHPEFGCARAAIDGVIEGPNQIRATWHAADGSGSECAIPSEWRLTR